MTLISAGHDQYSTWSFSIVTPDDAIMIMLGDVRGLHLGCKHI